LVNLFTLKKFGIRLGLLLILFFLAGVYLNLGNKIAAVYTNSGNALFKNAFHQKKVKFKQVKNEAWVVKVEAVHKVLGKQNWCTLNIWGVFYLPFTLYLSLILATSFKKWKLKLSSFSVGLLLLISYLYCCQYFKIVFLFHSIEKTEPNFNYNIWHEMVDKVNVGFIDNVNTYLVMAMIIWLFIVVQTVDFSLSKTPNKGVKY